MTSHNVGGRKGPDNISFNASIVVDKHEESKNSGSNKASAKKTKLKGPQINITKETSVTTNNKSIVTKLKPWREFFDKDEF